MKINERNLIIEKYEVYKSLLSEKKQDIFEMYYYEDESINEIAEVVGITKNGVFNALKKVEKEITEYELKLQVIAKYKANIELLRKHNIDEEIIKEVK